jgi:hypothetical protein
VRGEDVDGFPVAGVAHAKDGAWDVWTPDAWRIALGDDATLIGTDDGGTR